jgi:type II secretion system protein N
MPDFKQYLSLDYWRAHRLELAYATTALALFIACLFSTFPYTAAMKGALAPMGLRFSSSGQRLALPFGARIENVSIRPLAPGTPALFESSSVRVWPSLGSLLLLHPGISASAAAYSGTLKVHVDRRGNGAFVSFDAEGIDLAALHLLHEIGAALGGQLSGDGELTFDPASPPADSGLAQLRAKGFLVRIASPMPPISLGEVDLKLHIDDGVAHVDSFKSSGGDLAIDGHGTIRIDRGDWHQSALALQFTMVPSPTARQRLSFLLNFLPRPPGTGPYKLTGTIAAPVLG